MSISYSTGQIQFRPADLQQRTREYSERSMIELRMHGDNIYSLRALDLKHDSTVWKFIEFKDDFDFVL